MTHALHMVVNPTQHYVVGAQARRAGGTYVYEGHEWRHWGADDPSLTAVVVDGADPDLVLCSGQNGLWRSRDGGRRWRLTTDWRVTDARDVAQDPHRPGHLYLALPDGIAFSDDLGEHWRRREDGLPAGGRYTQTVVVDRTRAEHVVAGGSRGLVGSIDGGRSWWTRVGTCSTVTRVVQSGRDGARWFATTESDGLWRSVDGAQRWHRLPLPGESGTLYDVVIDHMRDGVVAVVDHDHGLWWSEDGGDSWELRPAGHPPVRAHRIGVDPTSGALLLATYGRGLLRSTDDGVSWHDAGWSGSEVRAFSIGPLR